MFSLIPPPYKQYAQAAGVAIIVIALGSFVAYEKHKSTVAERDKWVSASQKHALEVQTKLIDMTTKAKEESERSAALAQQIEALLHEQNEKARNSKEVLDYLNSDDGRVLQSKVCRRYSGSSTSKDNNPVVHEEPADASGFSREFEEFLNAQDIYEKIDRIWMGKVKEQADAWCEQNKDIFNCE